MKIGIIGSGKLGSEVAKLIKDPIVYNKNDDFLSFQEKCDVLVDCSTSGFDERADNIYKPIVIATTQKITKYPKSAHMIIPNGSISWHIVQKSVINLAKTGKYDFLITEIHHKHKKDSPSGTARKLIKELEDLGNKVDIACARGFDVVGVHSICAFNEDEIIKIEHQIKNRSVFAKGIVQAAYWIIDKPALKYFIDDILKNL